MPTFVKVAGTWRSFAPKVKVAGAWRNVQQGFVKVAGVWRKVYENVVITVPEGSFVKHGGAGTATCQFAMDWLGNWTVTADTPHAALWMTGGNGNDYDVYCQPTAGALDPASSPVHTWLSFANNAYTWIEQRLSNGSEQTTMLIHLRKKSDPATIIATGTIILTAIKP